MKKNVNDKVLRWLLENNLQLDLNHDATTKDNHILSINIKKLSMKEEIPNQTKINLEGVESKSGLVENQVKAENMPEIIDLRNGYECEMCHKEFKTVIHLQDHLETSHGIKNFNCDKCGKPFSYTLLLLHKKECNGMKILK